MGGRSRPLPESDRLGSRQAKAACSIRPILVFDSLAAPVSLDTVQTSALLEQRAA